LDTTVKKFIAMMLLGAFLCVSTVSTVGCKGEDTTKKEKDTPKKEKDAEKK
jgi:hypothetical protein